MTREELEKKYLGLRVAVYSYEEREKARVISVTEEGFLKVVFDTGTKLSVHPKQVRLLKKKERRRIWVKFKQRIETTAPDGYTKHVSYHDCVYYPDGPFPGDAIEFIEVKK